MGKTTGFVRHFYACNKHDLSRFTPFFIGEEQLGWVTKERAALLLSETGLFVSYRNGLALAPRFDRFETRSKALAEVAEGLSATSGKPLRHEMYPLLQNWGDEPLAQIDRSAVPAFGVRGFGVHVNGFVRKADGIHVWIGERSADRPVDPSKLDNMIGGGQPIGLTIEENIAKEAYEEAGIEASLAAKTKIVRPLSYRLERGDGLRNDTLFVGDLELPEDFIPRNTDGEVAAFHLMPALEVAALVHDTDRIKFNCNLVIIDFLIRQGVIDSSHAEYEEIRAFLN